MKKEHKLTEVQAQFVQQVRTTSQEIRRDYLAALGAAKEHEDRQAALQANLQQQIDLIVRGASLPEGAKLTISADGLTLIVETPDASSVPLSTPKEPSAADALSAPLVGSAKGQASKETRRG